MKKNYLFVLLLLMTVSVNQAYAGWPIGKYRNVVIPSFNFYQSHDSWTSNGTLVKGAPGAGFTSYAIGLYVGYGITRRLDLIINVIAPQQNSAFVDGVGVLNNAQSSGFGDAQIGLSYNLVNFGYKSFLSIGGSVILPLYDTTKTVALGYAAYGSEIKLMYSGGIDAGLLKHTYYNMELGYRRYYTEQGPNVILYTASLGLPIGKRNQIGVESSGQISSSNNKSFNPNLALNRDFAFNKASLNYGHTFTRRLSVFVVGFYTLFGRNTGRGYGGSVQLIAKL